MEVGEERNQRKISQLEQKKAIEPELLLLPIRILLSKSKQFDQAITPATISNLFYGEFGGIVTDNPDQSIDLKAFHGKVINNKAALDV